MELQPIQSKIYEIRGQRVMLDRDLAELYQVTTSALNQAVKRNIERFPPDFMFQLTDAETENWKSQIVITNSITMGLRRNPYAFTEQGVSMLSAVLKSSVAIQVSIAIMRAFVAMRNYITTTTTVTAELAEIRAKLALLEPGWTPTMPRRSAICRKICARSLIISTTLLRRCRSRYRRHANPPAKLDSNKRSKRRKSSNVPDEHNHLPEVRDGAGGKRKGINKTTFL